MDLKEIVKLDLDSEKGYSYLEIFMVISNHQIFLKLVKWLESEGFAPLYGQNHVIGMKVTSYSKTPKEMISFVKELESKGFIWR